MGYTTRQYSKKEIIEKYQNHINNYKNIVDELKLLQNSLYVKEKNIGIFLNEHVRFCIDAVDVLESAINQIKNNTVDNYICKRLEGLFESCKYEHKKLEDTYSRVNYEQSEDFYTYEDIHRKLRAECDEMEYCDETVKFMETMIISDLYINIFNSDVQDVSIQQGTVDSTQTKCEKVRNCEEQAVCPRIEKEKTSFKMILKREFVDLIIGVILILVSTLVKKIMEFEGDSYIHIVIYIWCIIIYIICIVVAVTFIISFCWDLICMTKLSKKGGFVEFMSKKYCIYVILNIFKKDIDNDNIFRQVGKCFKNDDGEIYQIKSTVCPCCESKPIGKMRLVMNIKANKYIWRCLENSSHEIEFDYKQKF